MKDMKFKVICLILVIPLLLIFATGTIVKVSDIYVDIPVSEVKISGSGIEIQQGAKFVNKDLANADGGNRYELHTDVYPENATHKTVSYELIEGDDKGIELSGGSVVSKKPGKYKIKAMSGQCSDTVTLNFYSTKPLSLEYAEDANKDIYVKRGIAISLQNNVKSDVDNAWIYWETKNGKGTVFRKRSDGGGGQPLGKMADGKRRCHDGKMAGVQLLSARDDRKRNDHCFQREFGDRHRRKRIGCEYRLQYAGCGNHTAARHNSKRRVVCAERGCLQLCGN